jgi:hypothetical protein
VKLLSLLSAILVLYLVNCVIGFQADKGGYFNPQGWIFSWLLMIGWHGIERGIAYLRRDVVTFLRQFTLTGWD